MPKLLQINVTANWGSTGKIAEQIGLCAQAHGWKSYIAYGRMMNPSMNELIKIGNTFDVYEHYAEARLLDNEGVASRRATRRLLQRMDEIQPDVVHLHNIHDHYLNYPILFRYLADKKIPVVWTQHDIWSLSGHCDTNLLGCEKWKTECKECPAIGRWSLDRSERNFKLKKELLAAIPSLTIIPVSDWLAGMIKESHLGVRSIQVIKNGIDLNVFRPLDKDVRKRFGIPTSKRIVLGVAMPWSERKGLPDFLKLYDMLETDKYQILLVGLTKAQIAELPQGIIGIERTSSALDLAEIYSASDVFVNTTYYDNYPTTNLEAMACGTPVITYNTGGSPEAVDVQTGAVVEQGDLAGLKREIERLANGNYHDACLARASDLFDNNKCFDKYIKIYSDLIGGGKFVVIGVSSVWHDGKGLHEFIQLSQNPAFQVVLVGVKEEQKASLPKEIIAVTRTNSQAELALYYSFADVLVNPTYADSFPTVNMESLACGTPVITYDTDGSPEIINDKTGIVVEKGNFNALQDAIIKMKDKPLSSADCRKRAEELFNKDKCFEKYIELYERLIL